MPRQVRGPDGVIRTFPDDATDAEIAEALETALGAPDAATGQALALLGVRPGVVGLADPLIDGAKGIVKGVGQSVVNAGKLIHLVPGFSEGIDLLYGTPGLSANAFGEADRVLAPTNTPEAVGKFAEQVGEYFIPGVQAERWAANLGRVLPRAVPRIVPRMAVESGINAGVTGLHGGDMESAAAIGAAVPVAGRVATKTAEAVGQVGKKLVRSAVKPTVTAMKRQAGASQTGINRQADRLVDFILEHKLTSPEKAQAVIDAAEREVQRLLRATRGVATDAAQRAQRYLEALERSAQRQGLPADDVAIIRAKAKELLDESPLSTDVTTTVMQSSPSGLVGPTGQPVMVPTPVTSRALRTDVGPEEALELARGSGRWGNRKAWGEQKGAAREASKAVERAARDAAKTAVPAARALLQRQGQAIEAREVLDRMAFREANREGVSPFAGVAAAAEVATGRLPVMAAAMHVLRNYKMQLGIYAKGLQDAVARNDVQKAAAILTRLGVSGYEQASVPRPAYAGQPSEISLTIRGRPSGQP